MADVQEKRGGGSMSRTNIENELKNIYKEMVEKGSRATYSEFRDFYYPQKVFKREKRKKTLCVPVKKLEKTINKCRRQPTREKFEGCATYGVLNLIEKEYVKAEKNRKR